MRVGSPIRSSRMTRPRPAGAIAVSMASRPISSRHRGWMKKICWLKIHDRRPQLSRMVCKFEAREVVREAGYGHLLKELYGVWDRPEDIDFDALPDKFALKGTLGTKQNYFHESDQAPDRDALRELAKGWLETDHASYYGEWAYRGIKPRILAEELLPRATQDSLPELRVFCFGGEPRFLRRGNCLGGPAQTSSFTAVCQPGLGHGLETACRFARQPPCGRTCLTDLIIWMRCWRRRGHCRAAWRFCGSISPTVAGGCILES